MKNSRIQNVASHVFLAGLLLFFISFPACSNSLKEELSTLIKQKFPHATVGILVQDVDTGETLYQCNTHKLLKPASNTKVLTALAALYLLGPDYRYDTALSHKDNNFYLTFSGSPSLKTEHINGLFASLSQEKINTIKGDIVLDISRFKPPYNAAGITYDDLGWYYEAPSTAVILDDNKEVFQFTTPLKSGAPVQVKAKNSEKNALTLINDVVSVTREQEKQHCNFNIDIKPNNTLHLYGCLAQRKHPRTLQLAIPDPVLYAKQVIKKALQKNNITFKGKLVVGNTPEESRLVASHQSDELTTLLKHMLEESDNLYADSITKLLGYKFTGEGTYKQGVFAIKETLSRRTRMDMTLLRLTDGQGGRYNLISPDQMVILLTDIYRDKQLKPIFLKILPRMGVAGTLKDRMKNTILENRVLAKTGTMSDITAISGYLLTADGKTLVFSIIVNGVHGNIYAAKAVEDQILLAIARHYAGPESETESKQEAQPGIMP
ncbi:D-alanyl-D-alanine carboxypeptidase/D-alanyl-D-alanine endopeptidase [Legionella spiritensis]|uniref:D-Ala-D-Ala carboxypeptidase n=1 Tax=Legionella spiritensis TaxID=452 RepID=A0A0W0YW83_LEGSP|nr:D-alanyl-D-alanine carboxypeptidase/D-alanyl-D-alanine-endopeptidase [Legionella spiritensis]KTD61106.1 D-Ala-D-Ala carboxypeptidase [Legionella spiritensis]SNV44933.1 D-Ala-D-Ala carboxypeptidase [Legionella spiritensis]